MNLSRLERMVVEGDFSKDALRYLVECKSECEWLDYKEQLHLDNDFHLCNFARDVLAMKNVGGGYIVVGIVDKTWEPKGIPAELNFDSKRLRDQVRKATGVEIEVDIVHHQLTIENDLETFALIYIT